MPTILKRSGKTEAFDQRKIKRSLIAASDDIGQPMGESDIALILSDMNKMLNGKQEAASSELYMMLCGSLYARGFKDVLQSYTAYVRNAWKKIP